jgi:fluoroacetyl-CoA thioesterase
MKSGLKKGQTAEIEFVVTADMFARFPTGVVHELLSTSALMQQMEWAARQIILPYLEPHEEGMGARVEVHHSMLTPEGITVTVKATVVEVHNNKIECEVEASHFRGKVAKGTVVQAIVEKSWIDKKIREMEVVEGIIREQEQANK